MSDFKLPSGRIVEIKDEPTYGDELRAVKASLGGDAVDYLEAKFAVMCPTLPLDEIHKLSRADGRTLGPEVNRRYEGRPVDPSSPFGSTSTSEPTPTPA